MASNARGPILHTVGEAVGNLFPGYFALVMATGIVSTDAFLLGHQRIAWILFALNVLAFTTLWVLTVIRIVRFRGRFLADVIDHRRGPGFFTVVAATCILGTQFLIIARMNTAAVSLWWAGAFLWLIVTYTFLTAVTVREEKPSLDSGINGAWLLIIVATQSLSVLSTTLAARGVGAVQALLFLALCLYLVGCLLYLIIITLIVYRFTFFPLTMAALTPPYWINMGAVAITTLAGSLLISSASEWSLLRDLLPFLKGSALLFWAAATWWIPLLLILGAWRHVVKRFPLQYDPQYWGMVFPIGMYGVCTYRLADALGLPFLSPIPRYALYLSLLAWAAAFCGLLVRLTDLRRERLPERIT